MKKISRDAADAFLNKRKFKQSNTWVQAQSLSGLTVLWLHGNPIATHGTTICISHQGYHTAVTRDRLNAILWHPTGYQISIAGGKSHFRHRKTGKRVSFPRGWYDINKIDQIDNKGVEIED